MLQILIQIGSIYLAGITGIYKGIPVGIALKAHPVLIASFTALGSITAVVILHFSGGSFKKWVFRKIGTERLEKKKGKFNHLMEEYGVVGLGLVACGTIGPIATILLGLLTLADTSRLVIFMIFGIVLWSFALTAVAVLGIDAITALL